MARRDSNKPHRLKGIAENLHIKGNTAGTSNELSLSVLDERSKSADEQKTSTPRLARLNKVSVFAVRPDKKSRKEKKRSDGPTGADLAGYALDLSSKGRAARARKRALDNPDLEIRRRKSARRARRIGGIILGLAVSAALVGFAAYSFWNAYREDMENLSLLDKAMAELETADEVVLAADALVTDGIGDTPQEEIDALLASADDARTHINAASAFAESAHESMEQSTDKEAALKTKDSASARATMLDDALAIIEAEAHARDAASSARSCWDAVLSADALLKEAAALVTDTTEENVRASQEKSIQAQELLNDALSSLTSAQEAYPAADFSNLQSYIETRLEAIGYALASDEAIYIQDKATADEQNALYNEKDAEAVEIAHSLPDDPAQPVEDAYEEDTKQARERYLQTREAAAQSDAFIRDYLGEKG